VTDLPPAKVVASFDSASVLHAGLAAALAGRPFPHLGNNAAAAAAIRVGGRLPWPLLRRLYTRIGASEGIAPDGVGDVDMAAVAAWLADTYPRRRYPAAMIGSSNGALAHLAAALQIPWLPGTVLVPVSRTGDPQRPVDALRFGRDVAPALLDRNPEVVLHHMHDQVQDELMVARMTYFRLKYRALPDGYARFLADSLAPGAPVVLVEDRSTWPVTRVGDRHVFQTGAQGGLLPDDYLTRAATPRADDEATEAEWGADPQLATAVADWCSAHGHPLVRLGFRGPQAPAHAVATTLRRWYAARRSPARTVLRARRPVAHRQHRDRSLLDVLLRPGRAARVRGPPGRSGALPDRRHPAVPARRPLQRRRHAGPVGRGRPPPRRDAPHVGARPRSLPPRHRHHGPLREGAGRAAAGPTPVVPAAAPRCTRRPARRRGGGSARDGVTR
jgi:hypothetical protein